MPNTVGLGIVCDFDGTITTADIGRSLLANFSPPGWEYWVEETLAGRMTDQEATRRQFAAMPVPQATLLEWALRNAQVRPGADAFFAWCSRQRIPITVASNGLDFYIKPILQNHGLTEVELLTGVCIPSDSGIGVSYDHLHDPAYPEEWDHKRLAVRRTQARGLRVAYIGDGFPDLGAACAADVVFACGPLQRLCTDRGRHFHPFEDFTEVLALLESGAAFGHRPPQNT